MSDSAKYEQEIKYLQAHKSRRTEIDPPIGKEEIRRRQRIRSQRQHQRASIAFNYIKKNMPELHRLIREQVEKDIPL